MALGGVAVAWMITGPLLLVLALGYGAWRADAFREPLPRRRWAAWLLTCVALTAAVLAVGAAFARQQPYTAKGTLPEESAVIGLLLAQVAATVVLVARSPGARGLAAAAGLLALWVGGVAAFCALMAIRNVWL